MTDDIERVQEIFNVSEETAKKMLIRSVDVDRSDSSNKESRAKMTADD